MNTIRRLAVFALFAVVVATPLAADWWVRPAPTPNTDVVCGICYDKSKGLLTPGYPATLGKYVGRFLDSQPVIDFQQPFRSGRARNVVTMPSLNRIYFIVGSSVMAYNMDRFFARVSNEALVDISNVPVVGCCNHVPGNEVFLRMDKFFYAEADGWSTPITDGQERLYSIDIDDQGYVYLATRIWGWGIVKDDLATDGGTMQSMAQVTNGDVTPMLVASLKTSNGTYYAVVTDASATIVNVYDVTDRTNPQKRPNVNKSIYRLAKTADGLKIGIATTDGRFEIYTTDAFVSGGAPLLSVSGPSGGSVRGVASDGTNFYIATDAPNGLVISTFAPGGNGYTKVADFPTSRYTLATNHLGYGDGYLVQTGLTDGSYELRLFKTSSVNDVSEVDLSIPSAPGNNLKPYYFKNYYISNNSGRSGYVAVGLFGLFYDSTVIKRPGHTYLVVTGYGLGDVYELTGSDSITVRNDGSVGTPNPNRPPGGGAGPFYGDPVGFTASTTAAAQTNITWDFGNPEAAAAADPNSGPGLTGTQITHRYSGLTSASSLPTTRTVSATSITNSNMTGSIPVTLAKPGVSVGIKNGTAVALPVSASTPIVVGDNFIDTSDGSVQSHFDSWTIDTTATKTLPSEILGVGPCAASHTLAMTAHYGPYTGTSPNESSLSDMPISIAGVTYAVRPFAAAITVSSTATDITFTSASRITADTTVLSAAQAAALQYKWDLLDANNAVIQAGPTGTGTSISSFTVAKSVFTSRGIRARLALTSPTAVTGGCAGLSMETNTAFTQQLNGPDPAINGDCTQGGPPCSFNITSLSGVDTVADGWMYAWSVNPTAGVVFSDAASKTFNPIFTNVGNYTVSSAVTNAVGSKTVAKTVNVTKVGSVCPVMTNNNIFMYYQGTNCSYISPTSPCGAGQAISFAATANLGGGAPYDWSCATHTFSWNWGDGSPAGSGRTTNHTYGAAGNYSVTVTITNPAQTFPITLTIPVGVGVPPPTPPPTPPPSQPPPTQPPGQCGTMTANANVFIAYQTQDYSCSYVSTAACPLGTPIAFSAGSFNYDFSCGTHSFVWSFGDGTNATTQSVFHTYAASNTYTVSLTITSPTGQQVSMSIPVKVGAGSGTPPPSQPPPSQPPPSSCGTISNNNVFVYYLGANSGCSYIGGSCNQNEDIAFEPKAFGGYDFSCATHTFSWDFKDGSDPVSGQQVTHRFAGPGQYNVTVLITVNGTSTPISALVTVGSGGSGAGPTPPGTSFPFDFTFVPRQINGTLIPHEYVFTAFATGTATATKYHWDFGDGSTSDTTSATINHAYSDGSDRTITLTVPGVSGNVSHTLAPGRRRSVGH